MTTKKKILSVSVAAILAVTAIAGTSLAYLTDTDSDKNVMTIGKVSIIQNELQRDQEGELVAFEDGKALLPATGDTNGDGKIDSYDDDIKGLIFTDENGKTQTIVSPDGTAGGRTSVFSNENNAVDKIVTVTNDGNNEAYVRTLFAYELPTVDYALSVYGTDELPGYVSTLNDNYVDVVNTDHFLITAWHQGLVEGQGDTLPTDENGDYIVIEVNSVAYLVSEYYYKNGSKLAKDETSHPSLKQIYQSATANNEDSQVLVGEDGEYDILVLSQAVQTNGFASAEEALNTAFGEVNAENAAEWFANVQ